MSTTKAMSCLCAISAMASTSVTSALGLPKVSAKIAVVFSLIALSKFSGSVGSTKVVSTP